MNSLRLPEQCRLAAHVFLMLKPGINLPPPSSRSAGNTLLPPVNRTFETCVHRRGSAALGKADIDRFLNQTLAFSPAGAGISDLQKDYRRPLGVPGLMVALVLAHRLRQRRQHDDCSGRRPRPGDGPPHLHRRRPASPRPAHSGRRARCSPYWLPSLVHSLRGVVGALCAQPSSIRLTTLRALPFPLTGVCFSSAWGSDSRCRSLAWIAACLRASAVQPVAALKGGEDPHAPRRLMREPWLCRSLSAASSSSLSSLFVASFQRLENRPLGFSTDRILLLQTVAGKGQLPVVWNRTAEALRAVPGVDSVGLSGWPLLGAHPHQQRHLHQRRRPAPLPPSL